MSSKLDSLAPLEAEAQELIKESDEHLEQLVRVRDKMRRNNEGKKSIPPLPINPKLAPEGAG